MDDREAWILWSPALWPDSVSAIHFHSNAASPATASLQSSLSSMKNIVHLIQAEMLGHNLGKAAQACFCERSHATAAATNWCQGRGKVHLLLRTLRNQLSLFPVTACLVAASPESSANSMHSPGYFTSYTTENFLYTPVVTLGHQISKEVVVKATTVAVALDAHPAKLRFPPYSTSGTGLPGILSEPLAWISWRQGQTLKNGNTTADVFSWQKMIAPYQHAFIMLSTRSTLASGQVFPWEVLPNLVIKVALFSSHHNHESADFRGALSAEETSSLTEPNSNYRQHGNR